MDITPPSEVERQITSEAEHSVTEDNDTGHSTAEVGLCLDELHDEPDVLQQDKVEIKSLGTVEETVVVAPMVSPKEETICEIPEPKEQSHEDLQGDSRLCVCCNKLIYIFPLRKKATNKF